MMRLLPLLLLCACPTKRYPPELPLDPEYTECEAPEECTVVELGCCGECNGGFAVAARADKADEVFDEFSERCKGKNVSCNLMACPGWIIDCVEGSCAIERGEFTY